MSIDTSPQPSNNSSEMGKNASEMAELAAQWGPEASAARAAEAEAGENTPQFPVGLDVIVGRGKEKIPENGWKVAEIFADGTVVASRTEKGQELFKPYNPQELANLQPRFTPGEFVGFYGSISDRWRVLSQNLAGIVKLGPPANIPDAGEQNIAAARIIKPTPERG